MWNMNYLAAFNLFFATLDDKNARYIVDEIIKLNV